MKYKIFTFLIFAISLSNIASAQQSEKERELSRVLTITANSLSKQMPMTLDTDTRLDSVATTGNQFIYNNTLVNYTAEQMDANQLDKFLKENVLNAICPNKDMEGFIELGVVMVYRYLGKNGNFITELSLDTKTCKTT
ncbi:hypothetical protein FE810_15195 [Thalassotalea litorea]|uniref:Uncharacterized protein n=1 Tax=Thalassotalea litorea TaxID=2020715 RepID=A0A5R9ICP9_9GAMM|nr:PA3611 family quorum-sensing-regulated virulence factor [Thalassotalea litorea]TLU61355.1 hypothetical protein FE810_15195 [Thalassotalea litorea]